MPAKHGRSLNSPCPRGLLGAALLGHLETSTGAGPKGGIGWWELEGFASFVSRLIHVGRIWGKFRGVLGWRIGSNWRFAVLVPPREETQLISRERFYGCLSSP